MIMVDNNRLELDYITISVITIVNNNRLELDYFPFSWERHEANQHEANQHHLVVWNMFYVSIIYGNNHPN